MLDESLYRDALFLAEKNGARDAHRVALKILDEDSEESIRARADEARNRKGSPARTDAWTIDPSPVRNNPDECSHRALDDTGWCAGCSTQVRGES